MFKFYYNSKNFLPADNARNSVIDSPSINLCITDDKNQICLMLGNASWNGTFDLDTETSVTPRLLFGRLLLYQINLSCIVELPFKNVPNLKSGTMKN